MANKPMVPAVITYKFQTNQFDAFGQDAHYDSPALEVVHNGVKLSFVLSLCGNQSDPQNSNSIGVFVNYLNGPKQSLKVGCSLYATKNSTETPWWLIISLKPVEFSRGGAALGVRQALSRSMNALCTQKLLHNQNSELHIMASLLIPSHAFHDRTRDHRHRVPAPSPVKIKEIVEKPTLLVNPVFDALYKQIREPVDTTSPHNFGRFDFISRDDHHFYIHKDILSASSEPFKQMFEFKPEDAQFAYIKEGCMKLENLCAGALNEMFSYIYLAKTTPEFSKYAMNIVEGASMYGLHGLMSLCEQEIIKQTKQMDHSAAFECLQMSQRHNLTALIKASADTLEPRVLAATDIPEDLLIEIVVFSRKHDHKNLTKACESTLCSEVDPTNNQLTPNRVLHFASIASKYEIESLMAKCGQWFARNWDQVMVNGLRAFVEDNTEEAVLMRVLGRAISNKS